MTGSKFKYFLSSWKFKVSLLDQNGFIYGTMTCRGLRLNRLIVRPKDLAVSKTVFFLKILFQQNNTPKSCCT
jgi:hypothetical protein